MERKPDKVSLKEKALEECWSIHDNLLEEKMALLHKSIIPLLLVQILLAGCSPGQEIDTVADTADQTAAETTPDGGDGVVQGWAVLAEKDNYDDVGMTNLPVDYIGMAQVHRLLLDSGWQEAQIHEAREFDRESLTGELDWLAKNADQDDLVFVYVAAHGRYLRDVLRWNVFFEGEWAEIPSHQQVLLVDACEAGEFTAVVASDPEPYLAVAAVASGEYGWSGLEEEGLPIIGGVFTHYFTLAFQDAEADTDGDGRVSAQEAALRAETQQRAYMHEVVFAVPQFVEDYHAIGAYPEGDPDFPHVVVVDTVGAPVFLELE